MAWAMHVPDVPFVSHSVVMAQLQLPCTLGYRFFFFKFHQITKTKEGYPAYVTSFELTISVIKVFCLTSIQVQLFAIG